MHLRHFQRGVDEAMEIDDLAVIGRAHAHVMDCADQIVPYKGAALLQVKLLKNPTLKLYPGFPHGMLTTYSDTVNPDLLAFIRS